MTAVEALLEHLKSGKAITSLEAFNRFGISSLPTRISQLREKGYKIGDYKVKVRTRWLNTVNVNRYYMLTGKK